MRQLLCLLLLTASLAATGCKEGESPQTTDGEGMVENGGADGYPNLENRAGGGTVPDSTGADYMDAATGTTAGQSPSGDARPGTSSQHE